VKSSHPLIILALLTGICLLAPTNPLVAQASVLEANRNLSSTGTPALPPGAPGASPLALEALALVDFGNGQSFTASCHRGAFERVGLRHDQTVDIVVQYSTADAGRTITVVPLDGGQVIAPARNLIVAADGTIHFKFRVGHPPGAYQVALHNGTQELGLQFWVRDEQNPRNNPPVANPGN
jgi:hypothetical protein